MRCFYGKPGGENCTLQTSLGRTWNLVRISLGVEIEVVSWLTGEVPALLKGTEYLGGAGEGAVQREAECRAGVTGRWVQLDRVLGQSSL